MVQITDSTGESTWSELSVEVKNPDTGVSFSSDMIAIAQETDIPTLYSKLAQLIYSFDQYDEQTK
jgi:hypothetical protein